MLRWDRLAPVYNRIMTHAIDLAILGGLTVDTIVTAGDQVFTQLLGGSAAYAAAGARVWSNSVGVVARVDAAFPDRHIQDIERRGVCVEGIKRIADRLDQETFMVYEEVATRTSPNPASAFLRLNQPMPKALIGYQPPARFDPASGYPVWAPHPEDIGNAFQAIKGAHLASCPYTSQYTSVDRLQSMPVGKLSLDPDSAIMKSRRPDLIRSLVNGVGVFMPSETQARNLFGPGTGDVWQLAERLIDLGSRHVVVKRGSKGQCLLDGQTGERWLIPAYPCPVTDVTGAGHAYGGGFLAGWVASGDLVEAALAGAVSASLAIEGSGPLYVLDAMPGLAEARLESLRQMAHRL